MTELEIDTSSASIEEPAGGVDLRRRFIPDAFCPFTYLPEAAKLPDEVVLRQNQLHACAVLEMIQLFEGLGRRALAPLAKAIAGTKLADHVVEFVADEERHSALFAQLNRLAAPEIYRDRDDFFCRVSPIGRKLSSLTSNAAVFRFWPWLMHMQEEKSLFISRAYVQQSADLEENFVWIHREHAADEAHHVGWDRELIDRVWSETPRWLRVANAKIMEWMVKEFFHAPKRAGIHLLDRLAQEFPDQGPALQGLRPAMARLGRNPGWHKSAYSTEMLPRTLDLMDQFPEFRGLVLFVKSDPLP